MTESVFARESDLLEGKQITIILYEVIFNHS